MKPIKTLLLSLIFSILYNSYNKYLYSLSITFSCNYTHLLKNKDKNNYNFKRKINETYFFPSISIDFLLPLDKTNKFVKNNIKGVKSKIAISHHIGLKSVVILSGYINLFNYIFNVDQSKCKDIHSATFMIYLDKLYSQLSIKTNTFRIPKTNNSIDNNKPKINNDHLKCNEITTHSIEYIFIFHKSFLVFPEFHSFSITKWFTSVHVKLKLEIDDNIPITINLRGIFSFFDEGFEKSSYKPQFNLIVSFDIKSIPNSNDRINNIIEIINRFSYNRREPANIGSCSSKLDNATVETSDGGKAILHTTAHEN